ncbi:hypothetical protein M4951_04395 [Blastopirellula sp. J2-11]|uniref:hypothetical protein n=1 Tax=Blastopirellula sp. J2-11 TaxID=2943192 RepID=UPI0021C75E5C|nr:hypothetical protein [Blastopirellula sp. J2-11]UUO07552.1 hypothetical protein M4951_04395 [Blastopirellula sp. J2-11]
MMLDMFSGFSLMMAFTGAIFFNGVFLYRSLTILLENFGADIHRTDCFLFIITAVITSATVLGFYEIVLSVNISLYVGGKNDDLDNHIEHASRALLFTSILFYVPYFVILNTVARPLADDSLFKSICWLVFLPVWIITGTLLYEAVLRAARLLSALRNTK